MGCINNEKQGENESLKRRGWLLVFKNYQTKAIFELRKYAKISLFSIFLIFFVYLITCIYLCVNSSRRNFSLLDTFAKTEDNQDFQAKISAVTEVIKRVFSGLIFAVKTGVIGLNSNQRILIASVFLKPFLLADSILLSFFEFLMSFHLWLSNLMITLPKYRSYLMSLVALQVPQPQSFLVNGMVFGDDTGIPASISHSFKIIGMQHVMAASGFNVGLILAMVRFFISRFCHPTVTAFFCLLGIVLYVALIGAPASAVRAGVMVAYAIVATQLLRRQSVGWYSLIVCVIILVVLQPAYLTSVSFQLSVSATLGIILLEPRLNRTVTWFASLSGSSDSSEAVWPSISSVFKEAAVTTIAAQAFTLPLLLYYFGELSWLSIVANVGLLWLTPLITLGGVGLVLLSGIGVFLPGLEYINYLWGLGLTGLVDFFLYLVTWLGKAEWSFWQLTAPFPLWVVFLWWSGVFIWLYFGKKYA